MNFSMILLIVKRSLFALSTKNVQECPTNPSAFAVFIVVVSLSIKNDFVFVQLSHRIECVCCIKYLLHCPFSSDLCYCYSLVAFKEPFDTHTHAHTHKHIRTIDWCANQLCTKKYENKPNVENEWIRPQKNRQIKVL